MKEQLKITKMTDKMNNIPETGFYFDEEKHRYYLDGKQMTGVTTILGVLAKPALIQWAANMAIDSVRGQVAKIATENDGLEYMKVLAKEWENIL